MSKRTRVVRVGDEWFRLRDDLAAQGVKVPSAQFADGVAQFIRQENMVPLLARRAAKKQRGLFL